MESAFAPKRTGVFQRNSPKADTQRDTAECNVAAPLTGGCGMHSLANLDLDPEKSWREPPPAETATLHKSSDAIFSA
jgi:hypothetical protein